uniref:Uncharacterized protein n=1 Tax=Kalanchoe fedtschenkoi TaxID=63787 RepID=A0A7N0TBK0_KALFE
MIQDSCNFGFLLWILLIKMSMNCLCHALDKMDSVYQNRKRRLEQQHERRRHRKRAERNWSGSLIPSRIQQMHGGSSADQQDDDTTLERAAKKARKGHRRGTSLVDEPFLGQGEPRLVRSSGMRRDWSFEDLKQQRNNKGPFK